MIAILPLLKVIGSAIGPIIRDRAAKILLKEGLPHAERIVESYLDKDLTSGQKRQAAINELRTMARDSLGIANPKDSWLYLLNELAYNKVKASRAAAGQVNSEPTTTNE